MKNAIIIYLIQFVLSFSVFAGQQDTLVIEGHFYLDGKPVFIKITNGRWTWINVAFSVIVGLTVILLWAHFS